MLLAVVIVQTDVMKVTSYYVFLLLGNCVGFIPWINLRKKVLIHRSWTKFYPGLVAIFVIIRFLVQFKSDTILHLMSTISVCSLFLTIFYGACINRNQWKIWIRLCEDTDKKLYATFNKGLGLGWKTVAVFIMYVIYSVISSTYMIMNKQLYVIFYRGLIVLLRVFAGYLPVILLNIMLNGYKILNQHTKSLVQEEKRGIKVIHVNGTNLFFHKSIYKNLFEMSTCFNKLFGATLLAFLSELLIISCSFMHELINLKEKEDEYVQNLIFFGNFFVQLTVSVLITIVY